MIRLISILSIFFLTSLLAGPAAATDSVASYDSTQYLVNKDIGEERWAISQYLGDGTVTGNVYFPDGRAPRFIWCEDATEPEDAADEVHLSCWGAERCAAAPCTAEEWTFLSDVVLPRSYLRPKGEVEWVDIGAPATLARSFFEPSSGSTEGEPAAGLQTTRDGKRILVSKDVGAERWAITQNLEDRTVTGNVFFADGGAPAFLSCEETAATESEFTYDCRIAEALVFGPIEDGEGNFFVNQLVGDDANEGTQAEPFATIQGAIDGIPPTGGRIYVAGGVYTAQPNEFEYEGDEPARMLVIDNRSRIEIFGSFNPQTWIRDRELFPSVIDAGRRGIVIYESAAITIDGFTIRTEDAVRPGDSSVGVLIDESRVVSIRRNTILTGSGATGDDGEDGEPGATGSRGGNGQDGALCLSPASRSGGRGGSGAGFGNPGGAGGRGTPSASGGSGSRGNPSSPSGSTASGGTAGRSGTNGIDGEPGAGALARRLGAGLDVYSSNGRSGTYGQSGGGGGGGNGGSGLPPVLLVPPNCGGGGGGGGGGGERGTPARSGQSGGSAVGIAIGYESDAEITDNLIQPGNGGHGGVGGIGGTGGAGGAGGSGGDGTILGARAGSSGGRGGRGGRGGDSGSGAGGSSIGVLVEEDENTVVILEGNTIELGEPGLGAINPEAAEITAGEDGLALELLDLSEGEESEPIPF